MLSIARPPQKKKRRISPDALNALAGVIKREHEALPPDSRRVGCAMRYRRAAAFPVVHGTLEAFGAEPVAPPAPPRPPLPTIIANARKADALMYGRADTGRVITAVVGQLDVVQAMEIVLDPEYGAAWQRAAHARLCELQRGGE
jgi:hypothetical protein